MYKQFSLFFVFYCQALMLGQTKVDLMSQSRRPIFSNITQTFPLEKGSALPSYCSVGQMFYLDTAPVAQAIQVCHVSNNWSPLTAEQLPNGTGFSGYLLSTNGSTVAWYALGGDVIGGVGSTQVTRLLGRPLGTAVPIDGQFLRWNASFGRWEASSTGNPNFSKAFTAATQVVITAAEHGLGTASIVAACYSNDTPSQQLTPSSILIDRTTFQVTVNFSVARSGDCVINGSGGTASDGVKQLSAGTGVQVAVGSSSSQVAIDSAVVPSYLTAKAIVAFGPIPANGCMEATLPLIGAVLSDAVSAGWPASLPASLLGIMRVSSPGVITVRLCNLAAIQSAAYTEEFRGLIIRPF